ncbi:MAG: HD domain-containing protein [Aphanocapsa lilacina HA4352-LM1]|jgi:HD superfamily phosphohydrolase|nr:HD domain-containing protein [Aphanocapsa lilacina HA4352-LM1]
MNLFARKSRTYHDPIHGAISLSGSDPAEALLIGLIDTPEFQRLRRIRQLDVAALTFHGAEGSRFTHSLGVLAVARRVFDRLAPRYPMLAPFRAMALCGALLHDIGHGPYSHASEHIFDYDHERWTRRILSGPTQVARLLEAFDPQLPSQLCAVLDKTHPVAALTQLVSGQLDCDRLDYLLRDSYFTGARYGQLDLDRIIHALDYDPPTQSLVLSGRKQMVAIEHYLVVRHFMYSQVYHHPKNMAARFILQQALALAAHYARRGELEVDEDMKAWLVQAVDRLPLSTYLACDDTVLGYHLHRWRTHPDPILGDLCRRFLDRDLFKTVEVTALGELHRQFVLNRLRAAVAATGRPPERYCALQDTQAKGYTLYEQGIALRDGAQLRELADASLLVRSLIQPETRLWLVYPREVQSEVQKLVES